MEEKNMQPQEAPEAKPLSFEDRYTIDPAKNAEQPAEGAESEEKKKKKEKVKKSLGREILEWVVTLLVALAAALLIRSFLFEPVRVDGASMNDTLANGEIMFVSKLDYASTWLSFPWQSQEQQEAAPRLTTGFGSPSQFDVVICRYPGRGDVNFVKRIIGMPGDTVKIEGGYLYVNGEKYEEPYINDAYRVNTGSQGESFDEVYVPKKGDPVRLEYMDDAKTLVGFTVGGQTWIWRGISSDAVSAAGDRLRYTHDGRLMLNGEDISGNREKILSLIGTDFLLEKDCYFVMGDHRNNSNDSRAQGPITRDMIVGHVRFILFPFNAWRGIQ